VTIVAHAERATIANERVREQRTACEHPGLAERCGIVTGETHDETQPWLEAIVDANARLDALMPQLRATGTLAKIAALGYRRADVVGALEALAADPSLPDGQPGDWFLTEPQGVTRMAALATRVGLGVGPAHQERVLALARGLTDPALREIVSLMVAPTAAGLATLLADGPMRGDARLWYEAISRARWEHDTVAQWRSARSRASVGRLPSFAAAKLFPMATLGPRPLLPLAEPPTARARRPFPDTHAAIAEIARRYTASGAEGSHALEHPPWMGAAEDVYDAFLDAAPSITDEELRMAAEGPIEARLAALDALGDASEVGPAVVDFLVGLVRVCIALPHDARVDDREDAMELWHTLDAANASLARRAPDRWRALVAEHAESRDDRQRAAAAHLMRSCGLLDRAILDTLALDPFGSVRTTARQVMARSGVRRTSIRVAVWAALRDRDDGYHVACGILRFADTLQWQPSERRRARRIAARYALSARARAWVDTVLHPDHRPSGAQPRECSAPSPTAVPLGDPLGALLTSTDGRAIRFDLMKDPAQPERLLALHEAIVATFVRCAPSSYMRLTLPDGTARAVRAAIDEHGRVVLHGEDPRILERIPG
jgi:hypothetical protein